MAKHECPRCGFESSRDRWWDLHPVLATFLALPAGYTLLGVMLAYPWFTIPATIIACAALVNLAGRRRSAIAARAEHEHRQQVTAAVFAPPPTRRRPPPPPPSMSPRHVLSHWPTTPIRTKHVRARARNQR